MLRPLRRRPKPPPLRGPAIQRAEQERARQLVLTMARRRQAQHLYDGLSR